MAELRAFPSPAPPPSRALAAFVLLLAGLSSGCGTDGEREGTQVIATTGVLADVAAEVAGPDAEVTQLIPDGADPHSFSLSATDRLELEQADLVVANGAGLEAGVPLEETDAPIWELSDNAGELLATNEGADGQDPHVWMDPTRVAAAMRSLGSALAKADPAAAEAYRQRADDYAERLTALHRDLQRMLRPIAPQDRELVTSHDSLGYFADRYGFDVVATVFPATGAEAEASAERLADLQAAVSDTGVAAVFAAEGDNPEVLDAATEATGVTVEAGLLVESPGEAEGYEEMLRRDAELIAAGLGG